MLVFVASVVAVVVVKVVVVVVVVLQTVEVAVVVAGVVEYFLVPLAPADLVQSIPNRTPPMLDLYGDV